MLSTPLDDRRSHTPKGQDARERILRVAERLLARRGFHGTSMRDVAKACEAPLASVVYHFARKEKLYGAVLEAIAAELAGEMRAAEVPGASIAERVDDNILALVRWSRRRPDRVRLLLRELLDNEDRVREARRLPLGPILETMTDLLSEGARAGVLTCEVPEVAALHLVGGVSYFVAATPTVRRIVGRDRERAIEAAYEAEALRLARRSLEMKSTNERGTPSKTKKGRSR